MANEIAATLKEFLFPGRFTRRSLAPLDAGLTPNDRLEDLVGVVNEAFDEPDDVLVESDGSVLVTSGNEIVRVTDQGRSVLATLAGTVGPIARIAEGSYLVGVAGLGVQRVSPNGQVDTVCAIVDGASIHCPTDIAVASDGTVYVTNGSSSHHGDAWVHDLMEMNTSGRLVSIASDFGASTTVAEGLAYPSGVTISLDQSRLLVSEAWAHRILSVRLDTPSRVEVLVDNFSGYPGRLATDESGGYWLAVFALRTQLVDFVLNQRDYVEEMMKSIEPDYWIRPALRSLNSGLEPLQGGQIRKLGVVKPWAPPRSYGLMVRLSDEGHALESWHSRGGGHRHGVTSVRPAGTHVAVAIRGGRQILLATREAMA